MSGAERIDYGIDAPGVVAGSAAGGLLALAAARLLWRPLRRSRLRLGMWPPVRTVTGSKPRPQS